MSTAKLFKMAMSNSAHALIMAAELSKLVEPVELTTRDAHEIQLAIVAMESAMDTIYTAVKGWTGARCVSYKRPVPPS